ncbi:MAG: hypothetical protein LUE10_09740 [Alistipes sp.]|nr:hypothetical protein [Alistipes sp.]
MKKLSVKLTILLGWLGGNLYGQDAETIYGQALEHHQQGEYTQAADAFDTLYQLMDGRLSHWAMVNGAAIYARAGQHEKALDLLVALASENHYSNLERLQTHDGLKVLRSLPRWEHLIDIVQENIRTVSGRQAAKVETELKKAKILLEADAGKLWGDQIWNDRVLVLCDDWIIYSVLPFDGSERLGQDFYRTRFPDNSLFYSNSVQQYEGESYAVVRYSYLNDYSSTIIHELFHVLQYKYRKFYGEQIDYMDDYITRIQLRLEYHALKNCLAAIDDGDNDKAGIFLHDAMLFRRERQQANAGYRQQELELETLEGMASYTGYKLSTYPNLLQQAIRVIDSWEDTETYIRSFPYATGPAYGLIFDHFGID